VNGPNREPDYGPLRTGLTERQLARAYRHSSDRDDPANCPDCGHNGYDSHDMRSLPETQTCSECGPNDPCGRLTVAHDNLEHGDEPDVENCAKCQALAERQWEDRFL
jgi:predicted RNA-binding Zn-ribbon protein involved in translation (DUF1610 family)